MKCGLVPSTTSPVIRGERPYQEVFDSCRFLNAQHTCWLSLPLLSLFMTHLCEAVIEQTTPVLKQASLNPKQGRYGVVKLIGPRPPAGAISVGALHSLPVLCRSPIPTCSQQHSQTTGSTGVCTSAPEGGVDTTSEAWSPWKISTHWKRSLCWQRCATGSAASMKLSPLVAPQTGSKQSSDTQSDTLLFLSLLV